WRSPTAPTTSVRARGAASSLDANADRRWSQLFVLMVKPMGEPVFRSRACFVCGTNNPGGLDCAPEREGKKVILRFTPGDTHRGFSKAVHGGITASLLDEVVGVAAGQRSGGKCATVELT